MSVRLSIILPVYNAGAHITACLRSLAELSPSAEVILCDGGSDDDTLERVRKAKLPHLKIIDTTGDKGIYDAMNRGIEAASGTYLYFMGADDRLHSAKALDAMVSHAEAKLILARVRQEEPRHPKVPEWCTPAWGRQLLLRNCVHHQGAIYHRSVFDNYRYPLAFGILADYHLNLRLWLDGVQPEMHDVHLATCGSDGISKRFTRALYREEWEMKKTILPLRYRWWQPLWLVLKYLRKQQLR